MQAKLNAMQTDLLQKNDQITEFKKQKDHPQLTKSSVKEAMQNIITMEVEQRTKAWILQNQIQKEP